jgi:hypothetical protein
MNAYSAITVPSAVADKLQVWFLSEHLVNVPLIRAKHE